MIQKTTMNTLYFARIMIYVISGTTTFLVAEMIFFDYLPGSIVINILQ